MPTTKSSAKTREPNLSAFGLNTWRQYIALLPGSKELVRTHKRTEEMFARLVRAHQLFKENRLGDVLPAAGLPQYELFHIYDLVDWNPGCLPSGLPEMKEKYGEGPFQVVAIRLHTNEARAHGGHPLAVAIEYAGDQRVEMSGGWFTKR